MTKADLRQRIDDLIDPDTPIEECPPPWGGAATIQKCPNHSWPESRPTCTECVASLYSRYQVSVSSLTSSMMFWCDTIAPLLHELREETNDGK